MPLLLLGPLWAAKAQQIKVFHSDNLPRPDTVLVYLPQGPAPEDGFPVVFMLHGWQADHRYLPRLLDAQALADAHRMALVFPDGLYDSWYLDSPRDSGLRFQRFFMEELLPWVDAHLPVDSSARFASGLSMGGHGAMSLALNHPWAFRAAASSSGVMDLAASSQRDNSLARLLGPYASHREDFERHSALGLLARRPGLDLPLYLDCGALDPLLPCNLAFVELCRQMGVEARWVLAPEARHDHRHWRQALPLHLAFFEEVLRGE